MFHNVTSRWLVRVKQLQIILLAILSVYPLCVFTVKMFPGYGNGNNFVDAVKMGYPYFWIVLLMGLCGIVSNLYLIDKTKPE